ncbi:hypothetical protein LTS17_009951 [Exophiala oligosperma]
MSTLKGKSVLVTGGASGMGLALTTRFAHAGAHVTIADCQSQLGTQVTDELSSKGYTVSFAHCDVQDYDSCLAAFKEAARSSDSGCLDVVALMAGVLGEKGSLVEQVVRASAVVEDTQQGIKMDEEEQEGEQNQDPPRPGHKAIDVNLTGLYETAYLALWYLSTTHRALSEHGKKLRETTQCLPTSKSLILIGSSVSYADAPLFTDYQASKFGVRGLFRSIRHRSLVDLNIRVNMLAPSFVCTPLVPPALALLAKSGVEPGKGLNFVDIESVVDVAMRFAVDENLHGRAWTVVAGPKGTGEPSKDNDTVRDLCDDEDGLWGGQVLGEIVKMKKDDGCIL